MEYDMITVGSATVDVFVNTKADELIDIKTPTSDEVFTCYPLGSKILIKDIKFMTGGGGTNTAVSFRRLGLKTAYLGHIGNDENGKKILDELKKEKIDFVGTIGAEKTNYSIILDSIGHDRTILVFRDASDNLNFNKIDWKHMATKWFYFSSMVGKSYDAALRLMDFARANKIKIAFNPSEYQVKEGKDRLRPLLHSIDILVFNRDEASILLDVNKEEKIEKLLKGVHLLGPRIVVITDGAKGAWCSDGKYIYFVQPRKIKVVETTGAGDAFASGFVAGLILHEGREDAVEHGMKMGLTQSESVIQYLGAKNKLLNGVEMAHELKKHPVKVKKVKF